MNYKMQELKTAEDLAKHWEFFRKGLQEMSDPRRANLSIPEDEFYKVCLQNLSSGHVLLVRSNVNGKPAGYGIAFENTPPWTSQRVFLVYAVYVPGDDPTLSVEMLAYCEGLARTEGIDVIETWARRINGAAFRYYEKKHKFKRNALVFRKQLTESTV